MMICTDSKGLDMDITPESQVDSGLLRYLKILVTTLAVTMIVGLIVLIWLVVMRLSPDPVMILPDNVVLPAGTTATAFTRGPDWLAIVTDDGRILIYAPDGRTIRQEINIEAPE